MSSNRTLTHEQARRYLQAAADGQLDPSFQPALERHLADCPQCQRFAERLDALEARLANELPTAWPISSVAEPQVASTVEKIHRRTRHNPMKTFLSSTARTLAFGLGILVLIFGLAWGIRTLRPATPEILPAQQESQVTPMTTVVVTRQVVIPTPDIPIPTETLPIPSRSSTPNLFPTTSFDFPTGFPASLETVNLYRLQLPEAITPENALQMAARLGVAGGIYSLPGEGFDQLLYEVSDGFELLRFINFAEQFVYETGYADPISSGCAPLQYEEQLRIATDFLNSQGLLDLPYQDLTLGDRAGCAALHPAAGRLPIGLRQWPEPRQHGMDLRAGQPRRRGQPGDVQWTAL